MITHTTKGPWKAHPYNSTMGSLISYGDISKGETIAIVCAQKDAEEGKAYARLIAAAPELLEVLKKLMEMRGKCFIPNDGDWWDEMAKSAIAKAEGR